MPAEEAVCLSPGSAWGRTAVRAVLSRVSPGESASPPAPGLFVPAVCRVRAGLALVPCPQADCEPGKQAPEVASVCCVAPRARWGTATNVYVLLTFLVVAAVGWLWLCSVYHIRTQLEEQPQCGLGPFFVAEGMSERLSQVHCPV